MAELTVTVTEAVTLGDGGTDRGTTNTQTITVDEVDHRILDVGTSEIIIMRFGAANGAGTFNKTALKYLRITNLDNTNFITLRIQKANAEYFVKLEPKDHFLLGNTKADANETVNASTTVGGAAVFGDILTISADADTAECQLEYFIASAS